MKPLFWPDGERFDFSRGLFVPPPERIGSVLMATSTLLKDQKWKKMLSPIGVPFRHTAGYLGESGVACYECLRDTKNLVRKEVLVFAQAATLYTHTTKDSFEFLWKDPLERLLFRYEDEPPKQLKQDHILNLLRAAESLWTRSLVEIAMPHVQRGGAVELPVLGKGLIRVSHGGIAWNGSEWRRDELEHFQLTAGVLRIQTSYKGEAHGRKPLLAPAAAVGNLALLEHLLTHALRLPAAA